MGRRGPYVAAIDQGTTGTRCMVVDAAGQPVASAYAEHAQITPRPGWVEHDPEELWAVACGVVREALGRAGLGAGELAGLGVTNQRESTVLWERRTGAPIYHAIVWQDTRTRDACERLIREGAEPFVRARTGLPVATYFSALKAAWILDHVPGARARAERGEICFGTVDSWLIWRLTGGADGGVHVTDVTNASRTHLMNLRAGAWDPDLLALFQIPAAVLPEIRGSSERYGATPAAGAVGGRVEVCADLGDQQAALLGQACHRAGDAKNTYGTGCFVLQHVGAEPVASRRLIATAAYAPRGAAAFALEGSIAVAGAAVQWLRDNVGLIRAAAETAELAASVPDSGGVYFVPAFSGLFAPHWDMTARGVIVGLTRYATRAHLVRATLEAICYQTREVVEAMVEDAGRGLAALRADGGAARNDTLMQLQADILGVPVVRPKVSETTALGAAYAAGLAQDVWASPEAVAEHWAADRVFEPRSVPGRDRGYEEWKRAVERARGWLAGP